MNRKGFTIVELLAVMTILLVMTFFGYLTLHKSFEKNRLKTFLAEALIISEGAKNRYQDDRMKNDFAYDLFTGISASKSCYTYESALKNRYVTKYSKKYIGSVEVCHDTDCDYDTKIWLTDGEHYLNGVITDHTLSFDVIDDNFNTDSYLSCGASGALVNLDYKYDYTGGEQILEIVQDGTYSLEAWGAQGGRAVAYRGGYGGYAYTEIELHVGDKLYINVGGEGKKSSTTAPKGGYNMGGPGSSNSYNASGGGATTIATKSGIISKPILEDYLYIVAGGGGGGHSGNPWCCSEGARAGYNGGGATDESTNVSQTCCNYGAGSNSGGHGGGYRAGNYDHGNVGRGGSGFIANPLTSNGVMYGYNVPNNTGIYTKTISTTNVSIEPITGYAKIGNGYARIKMIDSYFILYDLKGGAVATPNKTSYNKDTDTFTLNNPTKTNYNFAGWTGSNGSTPETSVTIEKGSSGPKNFVANYTPVEYTVTYNLNGGSLAEGTSNPTTYTVETGNFTLNNPTKEGYVFVGWTGTNGSTPQKSITIKKGSSGNKTYTAVYEKLYNVTLDYNIENYLAGNGGNYLNTGFIMDYDHNFNITMNVKIPTSGRRYLLIGNYDNSKQLNLEINDANKLRVYQSGNRAVSDAITVNENSECVFNYTASNKLFTFTYTNSTSNISTTGTLGTSGYSSAALRSGQDYRGGQTFTAFLTNKLQITSMLSMSYLPTNVSRKGYNFAGWYTAKTGGNRVTTSTVPSSDNVTYYAHWSYTG